ncbi:MAG: ABC transporter permease [Gemmatimonadota bacterium]|nr:ABC transporter permease [Gemmatimonadota bacterium]
MNRAAWLRVRRLVAKEFRQIFRDPRMRPMLFLSPIIQLLLFGYAVNTDVRHTATFLVDHDRSAASRELVAALTASGFFQIVGRSERSADLVGALDRGHAVIGLEIPPGFGDDLAAGRSTVQLLVDGSDSNTGLVAQGNAMRLLQAFALGHSRGQTAGGVELRTRAWFNPALESRVYNVPGVIAALLILMCLLLTALAVVREREMGTLEQLMVTPLQPSELMLGKTIPVAVIALGQLVLVTAVALLWFGIPFRGNPLALVIGALVYILAGLAFGLLISSATRTQQEAFMVMFLVLMPLLILSGFMYPISSMAEPLQWLTLANPLRHFLVIVRGIFLKGEGLGDLWPQYLTLLAMAVVALRVATIRFARSLR